MRQSPTPSVLAGLSNSDLWLSTAEQSHELIFSLHEGSMDEMPMTATLLHAKVMNDMSFHTVVVVERFVPV